MDEEQEQSVNDYEDWPPPSVDVLRELEPSALGWWVWMPVAAPEKLPPPELSLRSG